MLLYTEEKKSLMHSSTVLTVWEDDKLVGLARVLDDTEMIYIAT